MTASTSEVRSLIVVSKDYGELGLAMSFLRSQEFATRATMLLPETLYANNKDVLPGRAIPYRTLEDILAAADAQKTDLVFLFSGYLLSNDRLASPEAVQALAYQLRNRGCRVVTSDPFLGLASRLTFSQIDTGRMVQGRSLFSRLLLRLLLRRQDPTKDVLRVPNLEGVVHLYPTSIPEAVRDHHALKLSFFNPAIIAPPHLRLAGGARNQGDTHRLPPRWLFLVSSTDVTCQHWMTGLREFRRRLARLLWSTLAAGRLPTLIAPSSIVERLSKLPDLVELLSFCSFVEFEKRLLEAEYVFYWNAFSFSQQTRTANELPFFLFDEGHLAHLATWARDSAPIKSFTNVALSCHYGGWEPTYLDQMQRLEPRKLAELAEQQRPALRVIRHRWLSSPTPDEVVNSLLR